MYRTNNCGELNSSFVDQEVKLSGWVKKIRTKGFIIWIDLRDRYGITQLVFDKDRTDTSVFETANKLGREFVIEVDGKVIKRKDFNKNISTGEIEILVSNLKILNSSITPPFTLEDETDGGDELRMKFRYLDLRREPIKTNLIFRNRLSLEVRNYLSDNGFLDIETPYLIKSTPEGARDFVVPSRMHPEHYYALPQSPQIFKQLIMIGGLDKYYQIVKCFRDEDLRADRQPEFTQIDCEMSFVNESDVLEQFEGLILHLLKKFGKPIKSSFPKFTYKDAVENYGTDKPDLRFDIQINEITENVKGKNFNIFDNAEYIGCLVLPEKSELSRKEIDNLTDWVKRPQIGANGILWIKNSGDNSIKSSFDKIFTSDDLESLIKDLESKSGDLILIMAGTKKETLEHLGTLRLEIGKRYDYINYDLFCPAWITDFPLFEYDEEEKEFKSKRKQIQDKLIKFATRIPIFMYLTDYRERCLKDVITQLEPGLFRKVTGLTVKDFELLVSLGVFNSNLMNDAIYKFKRYEDASLNYTGIDKHFGEDIGLYDTVLSASDQATEFVNVTVEN